MRTKLLPVLISMLLLGHYSIINYGMEVKVPANKYGWGWSQAILLKAIYTKYQGSNETEKGRYFDYIKTAMDLNYTKANGTTPNDIVSGLGMAFLAEKTRDEKYKQKALAIYNDYQHIIKTKNWEELLLTGKKPKLVINVSWWWGIPSAGPPDSAWVVAWPAKSTC